ncbi:neuropeptides capa receptor isoform X1 [Tribolium castaneum]|uniref:CAPA receptor n=1 Tax=Tribolium castaneum TaxID=7070 RepID=A0A0A7H7W3_TRICA|nr:CAPA receptor [Tribolium castaneum]
MDNDTKVMCMNNSSSLDTYVQCYRGAQQQPLEMAIPLTVVNVLIFVSGFFGNVAVCIVIIKHRSLHTATNYYLFNLAISDLTLLIFGLPNDVMLYWHQYPWPFGVEFCKLRALLSEMASYVSVLTIVAFSTERYLAICYPLYLHTMSGLQRAVRIIACLWLCAFVSALPFCIYTRVHYLFYPPNSTNILPDSAFCGMLYQPEGIPLTELSTLIFFIIPMLAIAVQYTKMGLEIAKTTRKTLGHGLRGSVHRDSRRTQSNRSVIKMLSAVVIAFFLCWAPFHAQRLLVIYGPDYSEANTYMFFITGILYYFSSTLNPILYNVMSDRMRSAFKEVLCGVKPKRNKRHSMLGDVYSRSYNIRIQKSPSRMETIIDEIDEDKINLVNKEIVSVSIPETGNTLIYEIHYKTKEEGNCNNETPI